MEKLKVGDMVRVVSTDYDDVLVGDVGEVVEIRQFGEWPYDVLLLTGYTLCFGAEELERV